MHNSNGSPAVATSSTVLAARSHASTHPDTLAAATSAHSTAHLALRVSLWSMAGSLANRTALTRYEHSLTAVKADVAHGYSLLESLRDGLAGVLDTARGLAARVDDVESSQADMHATLSACTAQLRASRASLSRLDSQLQALLSERIRHDAAVDLLVAYVAVAAMRSAGVGVRLLAFLLSKGVPLQPLQSTVARGVRGVLRLALFLAAFRLARRAVKRLGLHSGVGTAASYASEAARYLPPRLLRLAAPLLAACGVASPPSTDEREGEGLDGDAERRRARAAAAAADQSLQPPPPLGHLAPESYGRTTTSYTTAASVAVDVGGGRGRGGGGVAFSPVAEV